MGRDEAEELERDVLGCRAPPFPWNVLVTGASRGMGRYLAERFLHQGHRVIGCSRYDTDLVHPQYQHMHVDVQHETDIKQLMHAIQHDYRQLHVLINNAGVFFMHLAIRTPLTAAEEMMRTNFLGTFLLCREAAKLMIRQRYGRIVNIGTVAAPMRLAGESVYAASKAAVLTFTQILARELGTFNITCNMVGPTPVKTGMIADVQEAQLADIVDALAIKRLGTREDVAHVVEFFVKPESANITGQVIYLGGVS